MTNPLSEPNRVEVQGRLLEVNLKRRTCEIHLAPRGRIRCRFEEKHFAEVKRLLGENVVASGWELRKNANGSLTEMRLEGVREEGKEPERKLTGAEHLAILEAEGLIGIWKDRTDIGDSVEFARKLRKRAWQGR